jgi:predicted HTH transcriptional regulator
MIYLALNLRKNLDSSASMMVDFFKTQKEGEQLDFKQSITNLPKIAKSLVAFANTRGGKLVIGINDRREVTGIDPEEEKYMLDRAAADYCEPPIQAIYEVLEEEPENEWDEPKIILVAEIPESNTKPHKAKDKNGDWTVYIRQNDKSLPAAQALVKRLERGLDLHKGEMPSDLDFNSKKLLEYVQIHGRITENRFAKLVNISKRRATKLIVALLQRGMLREHTHEKETYYTL